MNNKKRKSELMALYPFCSLFYPNGNNNDNDNDNNNDIIHNISDIDHKLYYDDDIKGSILSFHGGCFSGGNINYDKKQNSSLSQLGYIIYHLNFPKNFYDFENWMKSENIKNFLHQISEFGKIFIIGRSSGGYLAKWFSELHKKFIHKTLYICPIFYPVERYNLIKKFKSKTMDFFVNEKNIPLKTITFNPNSEILILAKKDENIPLKLFPDYMLKHAVFIGTNTHKSTLSSCSSKFKNLIVDNFY